MSGHNVHEIGIVDYYGAQAACILGLTDLLGAASTIALDRHRYGETPLRVTHWKSIDSRDENLLCVYDSSPRSTPQPGTLVIPPTMLGPDPDIPAGLVSWVRNRHAAGVRLVTLCSGIFVLAQAGLVDGKSVATHQICAEPLARRFPQIAVDVNQRIIDHGDIVTAGGFLAWVDLGLLLVDKILGPDVRAETARFLLSDPTVGEARYFTGFAPPQAHGDGAVLKAQEWVHLRDGRDVSLAAMATAAGLKRRTLLRRFMSATGMTPIEYCRAVRIARAREFLEGGISPKRIAQWLGYADVASFSRVFCRAVGLAPGAYRKRFVRNGISLSNVANKVGVRQRQHISETDLRTR